LVTRFEWGILADIQPPDYELRVAIIKKKAEQVNLKMPDEVLEFLAENLRSNIRQIEGAIKKLSAMSFLTGSVVSIELAQQCITELVGGLEPIRDVVDRVFRVIERHYGVGKEDLLSDKRLREIVMARHAAIYLIKNITGMSYPNLAKVFHKKNHTTMLSSYTLIQTKMRNEPSFAVEMNDLEKEASERH
jgi:chromosomal replication initiator protein